MSYLGCQRPPNPSDPCTQGTVTLLPERLWYSTQILSCPQPLKFLEILDYLWLFSCTWEKSQSSLRIMNTLDLLPEELLWPCTFHRAGIKCTCHHRLAEVIFWCSPFCRHYSSFVCLTKRTGNCVVDFKTNDAVLGHSCLVGLLHLSPLGILSPHCSVLGLDTGVPDGTAHCCVLSMLHHAGHGGRSVYLCSVAEWTCNLIWSQWLHSRYCTCL